MRLPHVFAARKIFGQLLSEFGEPAEFRNGDLANVIEGQVHDDWLGHNFFGRSQSI